jgi:hypothetical protein
MFGGGLLGQIVGVTKDAGTLLVSQAVGRMAVNALPFGDPTNPWIGAGKGYLLAVLARRFGTRFLGADMARLIAAGVVMGPLKDAIVHAFPKASDFLGEGVMYLPSYPGINPGTNGYDQGTLNEADDQMASYAGVGTYSGATSF